MVESHATVTVKATVQKVYDFFTHFNDFPKFMHFVKEVTYYDEQRSHWVVQITGTHEWDAVNEHWIPNRQIGWRSVNGLQNRGRVKFTPHRDQQTTIDVYLSYEPPAGVIGKAVNQLGLTSVDESLQQDLDHFAQMIEQAPAGALDPMQSHYLFHEESAIARQQTTERQNAAMANDPMMSRSALQQRSLDIDLENALQREIQQQAAEEQQRAIEEQQAAIQQNEQLRKQAALDRQAAEQSQQQAADTTNTETTPHPVHDTIGGRNASISNTAFGDLDGRIQRFPDYQKDPMTARRPIVKDGQVMPPEVANVEEESPWRTSITGIDTPEARAERERIQDEELQREKDTDE